MGIVSSQVNVGDAPLASQYNNLRQDVMGDDGHTHQNTQGKGVARLRTTGAKEDINESGAVFVDASAKSVNVHMGDGWYEITEGKHLTHGDTAARNDAEDTAVIGDVFVDDEVKALYVCFEDGVWSNQSVPAGMIGLFDGDCPTGWTEVVAAKGRAIVGVATGAPLGTIGTAYEGLEDREHVHAGPSHTHNQCMGASDDDQYQTKVGASTAYDSPVKAVSAGDSVTMYGLNTGVEASGTANTAKTGVSNIMPYITFRICKKD